MTVCVNENEGNGGIFGALRALTCAGEEFCGKVDGGGEEERKAQRLTILLFRYP